MARLRSPTSVQVNGVALLVKDPDITTGLFSEYQRVPGLANFTLPDETGSTNETQIQDGSISFAQIAGVGTITGSIGAITGHATHRFLARKRRSGGNVTVTIFRPAVSLEDFVGSVGHGAGEGVLSFTGTAAERVKSLVKEGVLVAVGEDSDTLGGMMSGVVVYDGPTPTATEDHYYRPVVAVDEDGATVEVEAVITTALTAAANNKASVRRPGIRYEGVSATVNGFGDGDFQAGGAMAANVSFAPSEALPVFSLDHRLLSEVPDTAFDGAFGDIT